MILLLVLLWFAGEKQLQDVDDRLPSVLIYAEDNALFGGNPG